jgi:adenylate cyclase class 2
MTFEVEQKFPLADPQRLAAKVVALGGVFSERQTEVDQYFAHPCRDFAATDEALRIRRVGTAACVTYKGPKIDRSTKTRREIELPLPGGQVEAWAELLAAIGFRPVAEVRKQRRRAQLAWEDRSVLVVLDEVEGLGVFTELELIAEASQLAAAQACLKSLAAELELASPERRSYLEMLLAQPEIK